jgi:signal transduction histidine kinase
MSVDEEKLLQVVMNLLLNAFEVSDQDGRIWVSSHYYPDADPPEIEMIVEDEGSGIPEEHLQNIFEPFFTTKTRGVGLGLTNVKYIVEAHGGRIEAENRVPRGAIFRVRLPV